MSMRLIFTRVMCAALLLAAIATTASAQNLVTNPGFETGTLAPWQALNLNAVASITVQTPDNGPTAPGTFNAFMDNRGEALGLTLKQTTAPGTAVPGLVFYSFDLKLVQASNGGVFFVQVFAENASNAVIGGSVLLGNYTPANWTHYSGSFTAPLNTDHLTIQFMANTGAVTGSVSSMRVDNVDLHQEAPVPTSSSTWGHIKALYR